MLSNIKKIFSIKHSPFYQKKIQQHPFTLMEVLLVMIILSLVTGVIGYNIKGVIQEQRFRTETAIVVGELRLAQDLMLILNSDIHVKFSTDSKTKQIKYWIESEQALAPEWGKFITRSHRNLEGVQSISFEEFSSGSKETISQTSSSDSVLDIKFLSGGSIMSTGSLILSDSLGTSTGKGLNQLICLYGYPHSLVSVNAKNNECDFSENTNYDKRLTQWTMTEINEYNEKYKKKEDQKDTKKDQKDDTQDKKEAPKEQQTTNDTQTS